MIIGYLKGQYIRITNPKRYIYLKKIRKDYSNLKKIELKFNKLIKQKIRDKNLSKIKIISRIKTIGSLDRKEKYKKIKYTTVKISYLQDDLIGFKFFVNDYKKGCRLIEIIKQIASFIKLENKVNPRNYFLHHAKCNKTSVCLTKCITGNVLFEGTLIHIFVLLNKDKCFHIRNRRLYLREVNNTIKANKHKI